jgi:mono/diheme cytochrome c family protein
MVFQQGEEPGMISFKANFAVLGSALVILAAGTAGAASPEARGADKTASAAGAAAMADEREVIPGADGMTSVERDAYRRRMAGAATPEEKARIRAEYVKAQTAVAPAPALVGDASRGAKLHRGCFGCHGIERYAAPVTYAAAGFIDAVLRASGLSDLPPAEPARFKGKIKSLAALRDGVMRRNDYLNPKMTPQEVEDVVAYLNATYYKFPQ